MAENDIDNENDLQTENGNTNSGKGLRAQLEQALAELATLKSENGELKSKTRATELAGLLKSAGAKVGAEKFYPKDAEVSDGAVKKWVEENAAFVRDEEAGESNTDESLQIPEETRMNAKRLAALSDTAVQRPAGDMTDLLDRMSKASSDELTAIYAEVGLRRE